MRSHFDAIPQAAGLAIRILTVEGWACLRVCDVVGPAHSIKRFRILLEGLQQPAAAPQRVRHVKVQLLRDPHLDSALAARLRRIPPLLAVRLPEPLWFVPFESQQVR